MDEITFEWDTKKAQTNDSPRRGYRQRKHGISFEEAETAFYDPNARTSYDPDHSQDEDRYILLGTSESFKLIVVRHVYRQNDESIRIISARRATKTEQKEYRGYLT
jgi:uncharacterized protein